MGDYFQNGTITTLHRLADRPVDELERELTAWSEQRPMAVVIPSLYRELWGEALDGIVEQLVKVPYLTEVIVGIDGADATEFAHARDFFSRLPQRHRLLWNDGPRLREIDSLLEEHGVAPHRPGKGRNVWYCLGYFLASGRSTAIALHDADIANYDRSMLARLFYPIVHPTFGYAFCKGFYHRATADRLGGRVSRLFVPPLIRALRQSIGGNDYLDYLDSFRYALAGESAMDRGVVQGMRIPSDWGVEIGVLSEVYRRYTTRRICQVDIADAYEHKHQELAIDDPDAGLYKMTIDIAKAMFRKLAIDGTIFSNEHFRTLKAGYYRNALDMVDQYHDDAVLNGIRYDRHREEETVEVFAQAIMEAGAAFLNNPMETPFIPSWSRVLSAVPDVFERLEWAVDADNETTGEAHPSTG